MAKVPSGALANMVAEYYCDWQKACKRYDRAMTIIKIIMPLSLMVAYAVMMSVLPWSDLERWVRANFYIEAADSIELLIIVVLIVLLALIAVIECVIFRCFWLNWLRNECDIKQHTYLYASALTGLSVGDEVG